MNLSVAWDFLNQLTDLCNTGDSLAEILFLSAHYIA